MLYFIPSWYAGSHKWHANDAPWYNKDNTYEFDDSVNQIRMFKTSGEETGIITLCYAPMLRCFLHRQNIFPMDGFSVFDIMQGITSRKVGLISYTDLDWPAHMEWVYSPYATYGYLKGALYVRIEFGEDGGFLHADYYEHEVLDHRDFYDDRGFMSCRCYFADGLAQRQEFFDEYNVLQFTRFFPSGRVKIRPHARYPFERMQYDDIAVVIGEVLRKIFLQISPDDTLIVASNQQHNSLIWENRCGQNVILSYFENRFDLNDVESLRKDVYQARMIVTDTEHSAKLIRESTSDQIRIYDISPFDTRLSLGKSQRIKELKVFMPLDGLEGVFLEKALAQVFTYMQENPDVTLLAGVRSDEAADADAIRDKVAIELDKNGHQELAKRIAVTPFVTETDLIRILYDVRLIVDVRDQPDLYLQIAGISSGIPQVNYRYTRYVEHQKDGYIIKNINFIYGGLEYYLSGLSHWNEALVYCVQEINHYTSGALARQWKERMGMTPEDVKHASEPTLEEWLDIGE